ncbi:MAG: hypothetical protein HY695_19875 [Deltaproteobacteria bacterium]|nr:hypothetical protein [Deltaproteobacteria bacterium]
MIIDSDLPQPKTQARTVRLPFRRLVSAKMAAVSALGLWVKIKRPFPLEAYVSALENFYGDHAPYHLEAIEKVLSQSI